MIVSDPLHWHKREFHPKVMGMGETMTLDIANKSLATVYSQTGETGSHAKQGTHRSCTWEQSEQAGVMAGNFYINKEVGLPPCSQRTT